MPHSQQQCQQLLWHHLYRKYTYMSYMHTHTTHFWTYTHIMNLRGPNRYAIAGRLDGRQDTSRLLTVSIYHITCTQSIYTPYHMHVVYIYIYTISHACSLYIPYHMHVVYIYIYHITCMQSIYTYHMHVVYIYISHARSLHIHISCMYYNKWCVTHDK